MVYRQKWKFEPIDIVFIDCVHDYQHVKSDIDNYVGYIKKKNFLKMKEIHIKFSLYIQIFTQSLTASISSTKS